MKEGNTMSNHQTMQWTDKVILVTGGASGIGRDVAITLARLGAKIIVGSRSISACQQVVDEITQNGGEAIFIQTDVSEASQCERLVKKIMQTYGRLDGAFNNAGIQYDFSPMHSTSIENIDQTLNVNLKGILYLMKYEAEAMLENGGGCIVNNASIFGLKAMQNAAEYIASKHGVIGATRAVALDYAQKNIRVNAICPGPIKTPSYDRVTGGDDHMYDDGVPMHRIGQVGEVTQAVMWLLSQDSSYVTGSILSVDGGMSAQ